MPLLQKEKSGNENKSKLIELQTARELALMIQNVIDYSFFSQTRRLFTLLCFSFLFHSPSSLFLSFIFFFAFFRLCEPWIEDFK